MGAHSLQPAKGWMGSRPRAAGEGGGSPACAWEPPRERSPPGDGSTLTAGLYPAAAVPLYPPAPPPCGFRAEGTQASNLHSSQW